jgi:hypothetical protein
LEGKPYPTLQISASKTIVDLFVYQKRFSRTV